MEERTDGLVISMIGAAVFAGAYRALARAEPAAERGLLRMAEKHSARVAALADDMLAGMAVQATPLQP